ncbi:UPF0193 protein EVG1 isoform X3 [Corythoichthys intestinalis]|nr:UPF0193 protein EVG1 isoform X3 [Corythoichthys intestinalis]XP_057700370.1 UPF0193 protein EVG1 isoform X3 [Corythoichthys intestinalis]XP_057700371.1 UPF0193 protein EVG1 isoform X3 [Corythoichthys intestinalis]XP_057700372.1 UPF0193 protein EVG1 isoform X3 [Corythoichthys intestinalis]XP_057700373.1 UPF0193 protein EVG1 isoform X3 [Corythoichthys intestinalis]XP_061791868.1 UPF0193 protein EVG1-like [Nerophis lumbriciformis]
MDASSQKRVRGVHQYSKETRDLLTAMMQQMTLSNLQRKQVDDCLKNGSSLPQMVEPSSSSSSLRPKASKCSQKVLPVRPVRRSAVSCRSGNSYVREQFCAAPTRDLEKEKRQLQNIFATGRDQGPEDAASRRMSAQVSDLQSKEDRCQEVLDEIEERRQFLADMASLGQEKQYIHMINTEISQKIRELEMLEGERQKKEVMVSELTMDQRL